MSQLSLAVDWPIRCQTLTWTLTLQSQTLWFVARLQLWRKWRPGSKLRTAATTFLLTTVRIVSHHHDCLKWLNAFVAHIWLLPPPPPPDEDGSGGEESGSTCDPPSCDTDRDIYFSTPPNPSNPRVIPVVKDINSSRALQGSMALALCGLALALLTPHLR